jgi:dipeptidyl aminopeptidase/acylaminoacyl peptidase
MHPTRTAFMACLAALAATAPFLMAPPALAAPAGYHLPDPALVKLVDAPVTPAVSVGPDRKTMLLLARRPMPTIAEVSAPELKLAGLSIDPRTNGQARASSYMGLAVRTLDLATPRHVTGMGADPRISHVAWAGDGKHVAFSVTRPDAIELWVLELATNRARRLSNLRLNAVMGTPFTWLPDSRGLIVHAVPPQRAKAPQPAPEGPAVQENLGQKSPNRTYPNLLKSPHDEQLFDHYATAQLARVDLDGKTTLLGVPALYTSAEPSPDGRFLLVSAIRKPYSYLVPLSRFPRRTEVWSHNAQLIKRVADLPLAESMSTAFDAVRAGRRWIDWRADADATLYWAEAPDGGDPAVNVAVRDRLYTLEAPFGAEPKPLLDLGFRVSDVKWGSDGTAIVEEGWWKTRRERTWVVKPNQAPKLLFDRSSEDLYGHPGTAVQRRTPRNTFIVPVNDGRVLFSGEGASAEGNRPFLDRVELATGKAERLWRSQAPYYSMITHLLDDEGSRFIVSRESPTEPPNYFLSEGGQLKQLTRFPHPTPQLANVQKELITYSRADGVKLSGTLYLPPGYDAKRDGPLPLVMWAYPQEYKDAAAAGQVDTSPYAFNRVWHSSPLVWLTRGFAVLDDPKLPIIGAGETEPNDTYVEQLVAGAQAAVDEVVRRGVADRRRIAIGGHSYGAFMTANLLAHSDLFAAGIARSGAYNRTLTPFGFQSEERTFWEAAGTYHKMSPFENANKINEPLLLIHGQADSNPGTFPMQSERLYQALKGLGGHARLVMLPHEEHGYRARESVLHMLHESDRWLERYVKNRPADAPKAP